jgi:hypothetical protein
MGYDVVRIEATGWNDERDLDRDIAAALGFPAYYGHNLAALDHCSSDVAPLRHRATGLVLVITGYDKFAAAQPHIAHALPDTFAGHARNDAEWLDSRRRPD